MDPAWNLLISPEYLPEQNFTASPKSNFEHVNCSDDQNQIVFYKTSFRPRVGQNRGQEEG